MPLRIDANVLGGALDFTVRGTVTGHLDVVGREEPVRLRLQGLPWPDLAGHRLTFHRAARVGDEPVHEGFQSEQAGSVGDMTASRKVRIPDRPIGEWIRLPAAERLHTLGNCLYLEWFDTRNGRVVLESIDYELSLDPVAAWTMGPDDRPGGPRTDFQPFDTEALDLDDYLEPEDETPRSEAEIEADREAARMELLLDRIGARMEREGEEADHAQIMEEERERLRRELGEPEPEPLTPEEEEERARWIEEMNAALIEAEESINEEEEGEEDVDHPLVVRTTDYALALWRELIGNLEEKAALTREHPFVEITDGVTFAGVKLAGALQSSMRRGEWPPDPLFAGDSLVRLKKARGYLHDALAGLKAVENDGLLGGIRLDDIGREIREILAEVEILIADIRRILG
jgi:hypothetical protein